MCSIRSGVTPVRRTYTLLSRILKYSITINDYGLPAILISSPPSLSSYPLHPLRSPHPPHSVSVVSRRIRIHAVVLAGWSVRKLPSPLLFASTSAVAETGVISPISPRLRLRLLSVQTSQPWPLHCNINGRGRRTRGNRHVDRDWDCGRHS